MFQRPSGASVKGVMDDLAVHLLAIQIAPRQNFFDGSGFGSEFHAGLDLNFPRRACSPRQPQAGYSLALSVSVRITFFAGTISLSNAISSAPEVSGSAACPPSAEER